MRTPQLTEQYGHVDRVSVARAILSSLSCAIAGVRSNPRREKAALPVSAPLRKVLRESSIASSDYFDHSRTDCTPKLSENYNPAAHPSQCRRNCIPRRPRHNSSAVACGGPRPHNRSMAKDSWQQRIRRAEQLTEQHPFAAEI